jgi:hypothetical protein
VAGSEKVLQPNGPFNCDTVQVRAAAMVTQAR